MGYHGLFMGCARGYWTDILVRLHRKYGKRDFKWSQVYLDFPDISKSDLTRLRSSSWIRMTGKDKKTGTWRLTDGAAMFCNNLVIPKIKTQSMSITPHQKISRIKKGQLGIKQFGVK